MYVCLRQSLRLKKSPLAVSNFMRVKKIFQIVKTKLKTFILQITNQTVIKLGFKFGFLGNFSVK